MSKEKEEVCLPCQDTSKKLLDSVCINIQEIAGEASGSICLQISQELRENKITPEQWANKLMLQLKAENISPDKIVDVVKKAVEKVTAEVKNKS
jgi:hypothetical protein